MSTCILLYINTNIFGSSLSTTKVVQRQTWNRLCNLFIKYNIEIPHEWLNIPEYDPSIHTTEISNNSIDIHNFLNTFRSYSGKYDLFYIAEECSLQLKNSTNNS